MTGPEHYAEAERLAEVADTDVSENWPTSTGEHKADVIALAQVHATLALAAAQATMLAIDPGTARPIYGPATDEWAAVMAR